jgi:hypothetical protein
MKLMLRGRLRAFRSKDDGAVTVDWVVLTASIVSLGMLVGGALWVQIGTTNNKVATFLSAQTIKTTF